MKILIIGTGYVGLVTGACISETGIEVSCIDIDEKKINNLKNGIISIYEPGLEDIVKRNIEKQRLHFSTSIKDSIDGCKAVFIAVGTPPHEDGSADISHVLNAAREVGRHMKEHMVIVTKSTVPIGTSYKVKDVIQSELDRLQSKLTFDIASNPEFLKEGNAVEDFLRPARIVIGVENEKAKDTLSKIYRPFQLNGYRTIFMDIPSAELTKYTANCMLATKISFMNEIANLCELVGADINMVRHGIGSDPRIGSKFIYAGAGFGGSCFPKDVKALIKTAGDKGYSLEIIKAVEAVNNRQKEVIFHKIMRHFGNNIKGKHFGIWGLSFKPNTDDMREAPSTVIISKLLEAGASARAYDPVAMKEARLRFGDSISYASDNYDALLDANALILMTEWAEFRVLNFKVLKRIMKQRIIFDGRNIYDPAEIKENGFVYYGIGRK
ncbi:MAG: UDP-glucose/GDP-mannose dehydrogenase family protein [Bacteroidales bacterium]|nr:UDP-glucose/GDP-mannose dehydrogenase family protein [Bacteroidales bacterium]MBN2763075.1 UDP-glucose/GDP-mannose dehydrogenase family protein [Bacteroidales bacterium]